MQHDKQGKGKTMLAGRVNDSRLGKQTGGKRATCMGRVGAEETQGQQKEEPQCEVEKAPCPGAKPE